MIVLGLNESHCATAAIVRDGDVVACASEERFSRRKNEGGYPRRAIEALLRTVGVRACDITMVALSGVKGAPHQEVLEAAYGDVADRRAQLRAVVDRSMKRQMTNRARGLARQLHIIPRPSSQKYIAATERCRRVTEHLGVHPERVVSFDHHTCHAAAAYYGAPFTGQPALVLTADGSGDGVSATVSRGEGAGLVRHETTRSATGSLGSFYAFVTQLLGMKMIEHEYKVMGLAPYADQRRAEEAAAALREVFEFVEGTPCLFKWKGRGPRYQRLLEATIGLRFDAIAGGAQRVLEDALMRWSTLMHGRHGGNRLALGGGVFMNVKANMLLAEAEWVRDLFVFPSCGDESNAVGAAYLGYLRLCEELGREPVVTPLRTIYLGPAAGDDEIEAVIRKRRVECRCKISRPDRLEEKIADLLVSDGVVARCTGRMEFGARALGNRSILANPSDHRVVARINRCIKNRDFWMPFAPTILVEREGDYLVNPKGLSSPHMMLAFPTASKHRDDIIAALHPHDATSRPQILHEAENVDYYRIIREFERRTGIGAVLNTSFNLHGEPVVCSPDDALDTFERSGLEHLVLGDWLISKR